MNPLANTLPTAPYTLTCQAPYTYLILGSMILPHKEQARLIWFLRWSEGEVAQITSNFSAIIAHQINELLVPVEPTESLNGPMPVNPTRSIHWDEWMSSQEKAFNAIDDERKIRRIWNVLTQKDKEALVLAFCIPLLPTRKGFGPYGNLADRTESGGRVYRSKKRRLPLTIFLDRLSRDSLRHTTAVKCGYQAAEIAIQCEAIARGVAARYLWAVDGFNATANA